MPKKLTILGALTAALVLGYLGLWNGTGTEGAPIQTFASSGANAVSSDQCYDTVAANGPVISGGRVACNPGNLTTLPTSTTLITWQIINLPIGNRLTLPVTYTPSGAGQYASAAVPCAPDASNRCTAGTNTGYVTSRTDIACNQLIDILASGGTGGAASAWPDNTLWTPPAFTRIAASPALGGGGPLDPSDVDSYLHKIVPFPTTGGHAWSFRSADLASLTFLYLGGTAPFAINPPSKLITAAYESSYVPGLVAAVSLLGGSPDGPPNDDLVLCLDSPQDSVGQSTYLTTPASAARIPRWTLLQSSADLGDDTVNRILDWQCDVIGAPAGADLDGDCYEDGTDPALGDKDADNDLVPDGVELFSGSNPNDGDGDTDNDGASDYDELFQATNPTVTDTDGDGQADKQDVVPTNGANATSTCLNPELGAAGGGTCTGTGGLPLDQFDATDDNCPNVANTNQLNTDSLWQYHGMGGNVVSINTSTGDRSNPDEDVQGDACDSDDDNDAIPDATEAIMRMRNWSGNIDDSANGDPEGAGDGTTVCAGPAALAGTFAPIRTMSPVMGDVDRDYVLDGRECQLRSRPDASIRITEAQNCSGGAIAVITGPTGGCAQPAGTSASCTPLGTTADPSPRCVASGAADADADGLYQPMAAGNHLGVEVYYRTQQINISTGVQAMDYDGDGLNGVGDADSDRDTRGITGTKAVLKDGIETRFLNSAPSATDSDGDGCEDGDEYTDVSGDGNQNVADSGLVKSASGNHDTSPADGQIDLARYPLGTNRDFDKNGNNNIADAGILADAAAVGTGCPAEAGAPAFPTNRATRHLP